ncbi:MAG: hypothetical protein LBM73_00780 [Candidatus Nomurabacteria bacterium]|jgi:FMN phosphatase YigB (HAD superfamily)|nr:hypothetical protein [Candidatus Nomurabacteria bacterium]
MNFLYKAIARRVDLCRATTITCDIFDTILLRNQWPEDLQFLKIAEKLWLPLFQKSISPNITAYELYTTRQYARRELFDAHYSYGQTKNVDFDVNLSGWFSGLIDILSQKYDVKLTNPTRQKLLNKMIEAELQTERENLRVNWPLVDALRKIKQTHHGLKIFFLSDMYLTGEQIKMLLDGKGVDIFDGGFSSTDLQAAKGSGLLYDKVFNRQMLGVDHDIFHNLHIGDNPTSDGRSANLAGSETMLWRRGGWRRKLHTGFGRATLRRIQKQARRDDSKKLSEAFAPKFETVGRLWQKLGTLLYQPLAIFLEHVLTVAGHSPNATFLAVSSEAAVFDSCMRSYFPNLYDKAENWQIAPKLNRKAMIRALVWKLSVGSDLDFNARAISATILFGEFEAGRERNEIYRFLFGKDFPASEMTLNQRSDKEFYRALASDLKSADSKYTKDLRAAYNLAKSFLPKNPEQEIVFVDVGWGGTVQILFEQFARLSGFRNKISGLYLGVHPVKRFGVPSKMRGYLMSNVQKGIDRKMWQPVIWEYAYTKKVQFPDDVSRLVAIDNGFELGMKLLKDSQTNPKEYFEYVLRPRIKRLISHPTSREVNIFGSIYFDCGFTERHDFHIVENFRTMRFWLKLLTHPRYMISNYFLNDSAWGAGYLKRYHLWGLRAVLALWRFRHR